MSAGPKYVKMERKCARETLTQKHKKKELQGEEVRERARHKTLTERDNFDERQTYGETDIQRETETDR